MGPMNVALFRLFQADQALREARSRLDDATRGLRRQRHFTETAARRLDHARQALRTSQVAADALSLDLTAREQHIEKLRAQQQNARNNKEYQAILIEIAFEKEQKTQVEEQALAAMQGVEDAQRELTDADADAGGERDKLAGLEGSLAETVARLQADVDRLSPTREAAAAALPTDLVKAFDRLAERFDGEAMAPLELIGTRHEEFLCGGCQIELVVDTFNRLHARDEPCPCPNCRRLLYLPEEVTLQSAVKPKKAAGDAAAGKVKATPKRRKPTPTDVDPVPSGPSPADVTSDLITP